MDETLLTKLAALSPLGSQEKVHRKCKVCSGIAPAFDVVDFQKICSTDQPYMFGQAGIPVYYYRCMDCEFLFTDFVDDWTAADFSRFIYNEDYIKVDGDYADARPRRDGAFFGELLAPYPGLSVLDYGGGAGVLAGVLRNAGFEAECYDPFSSPRRPERLFDVITCMEVIEHSPDPVGTLRDMASFLQPGGCILVGTGVQPDDIETVRTNWWYVAPRNGHVSLQSVASLVPLGKAAGLVPYPSGYLHGFASAPSAASAALLGRIGRPSLDLLLSAPDEASSAATLTCDLADWHEIEDSSFRWTARSEIVWQWTPPMGNCDVQLRLTSIMEIAPDFLSRSRLLIGGQAVAIKVSGNSLRATATLESDAPVEIRLVTPPPPTPRELYGTADTRQLGLAIRMRGAPAASA